VDCHWWVFGLVFASMKVRCARGFVVVTCLCTKGRAPNFSATGSSMLLLKAVFGYLDAVLSYVLRFNNGESLSALAASFARSNKGGDGLLLPLTAFSTLTCFLFFFIVDGR